MERFLLFAALAAGAGFGQAPVATGSLTGKVVDATTKAGVRKATVYATVHGPAPTPGEGVRFQQPTIYSTVTDDDGAYRLGALPPGPVELRTERAGYIPKMLVRRERTVVKAGEEAAGGELLLVKQSILAGRVTDSDGEPLEQVSVMAIPARRTRAGGMMGSGQAMTDDRGEFRIARLGGGSYKVLATKPAMTSSTVATMAPGEPSLVNAPTYFPSALEASTASSVAVGSGEERTGIEIRLQKTAAVRVAGRVTADTGPAAMVSLTLQPATGLMPGMPRGYGAYGNAMSNWHTMAGADGRFLFSNVIPGEYFVHANMHRNGGGGTAPLSGVSRVSIGRQDVDGLSISLLPLARVTGRVVTEGDGKIPYAQINIHLAPAEFGLPGGGGGQVKPDGTFLIENVQRTRLQVNAMMAPRGWYLKAITVGGQRQPGLEFDVPAGETAIELIYSNRPATVEVTAEGLTADSPFHLAVALPDGGDGPPLTNLYKSAPVQGGRNVVKIEGISPGKYLIVVAPPQLLEAFNDPAVWERLKSKAIAVKVGEGETVSAAPRLITDSDVDEK